MARTPEQVRRSRSIRAAMAAAGLTQRELTLATGMAQPALSYIVCGYRVPTLPTAFRIADALGMSVDAVFASLRELARAEAA